VCRTERDLIGRPPMTEPRLHRSLTYHGRNSSRCELGADEKLARVSEVGRGDIISLAWSESELDVPVAVLSSLHYKPYPSTRNSAAFEDMKLHETRQQHTTGSILRLRCGREPRRA